MNILEADVGGMLDDVCSSLDAYVCHYGFAEALALRNTQLDSLVHNDYVHFCIVKATKHLKAALLLIENGFGEDALALVRPVYECYINIIYTNKYPKEAIKSLVRDKLGLYHGKVNYSISKKGKVDFRKIENLKGEITSPPPSIEKMITMAGSEQNKKVHRSIYDYLSEHCHVNFVASGNYREGVRYSTDKDDNVINAKFFCLLIGALILTSALEFEKDDIDRDEFNRISHEIIEASEVLVDFIQSNTFRGDIGADLIDFLQHETLWVEPDT